MDTIKEKDTTINPLFSNEPFDVFYPPSNSFGMSSWISVNYTYFWNFFNSSSNWLLEYSSKIDGPWTDVTSSDMNIDSIFDSVNNTVKLILNFTCSSTGYYRLNFTINQSCSGYYFDGTSEYGLNITIPGYEREYHVFFNWSDVIHSSWHPYIEYSHGLSGDNFFFGVLITSKLSKGSSISIDPIFGDWLDYTTNYPLSLYQTFTQKERIFANYNTTSDTGTGYVTNISAKVQDGTNTDVADTSSIICGLYDSDENLLGYTNQIGMPVGMTPRWIKFNFSEPIEIDCDSYYYICAYGSCNGTSNNKIYTTIEYETSGGDGIYLDVDALGSNNWPTFDSPITDLVFQNDWCGSIYANYTVGGGDTTPPSVDINFAGNLGDKGGPYYNVSELTPAQEGYYTNSSKQQEGWIYINISVNDDTGLSNVWLNWYNSSSGWTNWTYGFTPVGDGYYEFNTSQNFSTILGCNYSFDVYANDSVGTPNSQVVSWNKTDLGNTTGNIKNTRRFVSLNNTPVDISFTPFYLVNYTDFTFKNSSNNPYEQVDSESSGWDRLHHDQGPDGAMYDTGFLYNETPTDVVHKRYCDGVVGYFFEGDMCVMNITLSNVYYHVWVKKSNDNDIGILFRKTKKQTINTNENGTFYSNSSAKSNISYTDTGDDPDFMYSGLYRLISGCKYEPASDSSYTDNSIYNFIFDINVSGAGSPHVIDNRSFMSYVIFNLPSNATLDSWDNDSDLLSSYDELFVTFTNPFVADTDNDGVSDYYENLSGSDPNNYTDTIPYEVRNTYQVFNLWFNCSNTSSRQGTQVFNLWFNCSNTSSRQVTEVFNYWFNCSNTSSRQGTQVFNLWFNCSNTSSRQSTQVFSLWFNCSNSSGRNSTQIFSYWFNCSNSTYRQSTQIFSYWFNCSNTSSRVNTQIFSYWFNCSNTSSRVDTPVFNLWFNCSNTSTRQSTKIFDYWFLCSNGTSRMNTQVFNLWFNCSNESSRQGTQVFNLWFNCSNTSSRQSEQIFSYWFNCSNTSSRVDTQVFSLWFNCSNTSSRQSTQIFSYWFNCSNISAEVRNTYQIFNYWFLCGNSTNRTSTQIFNYWFNCSNSSGRNSTQVFNLWFNCSNTSSRQSTQVFSLWFNCSNGTRTSYQLFNLWFLCGNSTNRVVTQIFNLWFYCQNTSPSIMITNIYPANHSINIPLQPTMYLTINSTVGNMMNITWYYGPDINNCTIILGTDNNIYNSTQYQLNYNASNRATNYYWGIRVDDGNYFKNYSYTFRTEGYSSSISYGNNNGIIGMIGIFGILGVIAFFVMKKKKKRNR